MIQKKRVELLSPAGDMACFKAAVNAGADAVYLAGKMFGARAYAGNFTTEEIVEAIKYAHLFQVKVYLTLNTLVKEDELPLLFDFVKPFYEIGLDGVIVQDFGVLEVIRHCFPSMEIHASTQMTVTGVNGAKLLKEYGLTRIVPARELSLDEIIEIKENVAIEVETFIHGAMCYAYSGQCLFSSILGGRSGNRGRCAGPCRLPVDVIDSKSNKCLNDEQSQYVLSLKDMCSLPLIGELIAAGIDSFKIEGRMKSPEYVAGVTSIYRKYIDLYYKIKEENNDLNSFKIETQDLNMIQKLYVRSGLETGYYKKHSAASMVTLNKPSYEKGTEEDFSQIREDFLQTNKKIQIEGNAIMFSSEPAVFELTYGKLKCKVTGPIISAAKNRPMAEADIRKQLNKTGATNFSFSNLTIQMGDSIFVPNAELNELRRTALEQLLTELLKDTMRTDADHTFSHQKSMEPNDSKDKQVKKIAKFEDKFIHQSSQEFHVRIETKEQLNAVLRHQYVDNITRLYIPYDLFDEVKLRNASTKIYLTFPPVTRKSVLNSVNKKLENLDFTMVSGFVVGNLELLSYINMFQKNNKIELPLIADYNLYVFNSASQVFLEKQGISEFILPFELNSKEIEALAIRNSEILVYGYIPLMETAGCVNQTIIGCKKKLKNTSDHKSFDPSNDGNLVLNDRYQKSFVVKTHCERCENTIYNSVPLSLHNEIDILRKCMLHSFCASFTIEDEVTTDQIIKFVYHTFYLNKKETPPYTEFTKGHFRRGVE